MSATVEMAVLPGSLRAINTAASCTVDGDTLRLGAGPRTDWFRDPVSDVVMDNAPALVMPVEGPWMLRAHVAAEHESTFDAAVLVVYATEHVWAKLCLELSPQGEVMVVSVVTRGASDDCNSVIVDGPVWLRVAHLERAFAFHYSLDGATWHMVRYFSLGEPEPVEIGFLAQSPTGSGCTATFSHIAFVPERLSDVRSGV